MVYEKKQLLLAFVLAVLAGAGLHFVYGLCPNGVTALFSPVNESIWEHTKILFWSYLAAAVWLTWGRPTGLRPWLLTGVGICLAMLAVGYLLHVVLGWNSLAADLVLYGVLMALGFWLPTRMAGPGPAVAFACSIGGAAGGSHGVLYLLPASGSFVY